MHNGGDRITLLTATGSLLMAKRWRTDGTVEGYGNGKNFKHRTAVVGNVRELSTLLHDIEDDAQTCAIRGGYIGDDLAMPIMRGAPGWAAGRVLRNGEVFKDRRLHMMLADIDGYESLFVDPVTQPVEAIEEFIGSCMPACFRGVSYHWQLSNSAGHASNAGKLKAHVWFWLDTPYTSAELKSWVKATNIPIDEAVFHEIQAHYTAAPAFDAGQINPVPVRSGFVDGLFGDSVPLVLDDHLLTAASQTTDTVSRKETLRNAIAGDEIAQRLYALGMVRSERQDGGLNIICPREDQHESKSGETTTIYYPPNTGGYVLRNFKCMHTHCRDVPRDVFTEALGFSAADGFQDIEGEHKDVTFDVLLGQRLANMLAGRYLHERGGRGWLNDTGGAWLECRKGEEVQEAKRIGGDLLRSAAKDQTLNAEKTAGIAKLFNRANSLAGINAALVLANTDPRIAAAPGEFDRDPDLLNVLNGVVHLPSQELRPHDPALRLSRQCAVPCEWNAPTPTWDRVLLEVSCNDQEWVDYLQRAMGYTLSGHVVEEIMFFLLGFGANGKSVLANVQRRIMGTYATAIPASVLAVSNRDGEASTPALAMLPGARLVLANEIEAGSRLSGQTVKVLVSTEVIAARHLYGKPFIFKPTHKTWVRANHKPIVADTDDGIWRRLSLVPFERNFAPHERDLNLEAKLMAEAPGILAWMVRGYAEYMRRGLAPCSRVAAASSTYRKESDLLGQWIEDEADTAAGHEVPQGFAYCAYQSWCQSQGLRAVAKKSFTRGLTERGIKERQRSTGARERLYIGMRLKSDFLHAQDAQD